MRCADLRLCVCVCVGGLTCVTSIFGILAFWLCTVGALWTWWVRAGSRRDLLVRRDGRVSGACAGARVASVRRVQTPARCSTRPMTWTRPCRSRASLRSACRRSTPTTTRAADECSHTQRDGVTCVCVAGSCAAQYRKRLSHLSFYTLCIYFTLRAAARNVLAWARSSWRSASTTVLLTENTQRNVPTSSARLTRHAPLAARSTPLAARHKPLAAALPPPTACWPRRTSPTPRTRWSRSRRGARRGARAPRRL